MNITTMRNTRVYSITMPPAMAKEAERLAKKESRTMSELMREAFRRYQVEQAQAQLLADPKRPQHLAELAQLMGELRQEAKEKGLDKMNKRQINAAVAAARRDLKKSTKRPAK